MVIRNKKAPLKEIDFHLVDFGGMEQHLCDGVHFGHDGYVEMARRWYNAICDHL